MNEIRILRSMIQDGGLNQLSRTQPPTSQHHKDDPKVDIDSEGRSSSVPESPSIASSSGASGAQEGSSPTGNDSSQLPTST